MQVGQLAVSSLMSLELPEQNKRHVFVPIWPWWTMCSICGRILLGITRRCPLSNRPFSMLMSSLKFQKFYRSGWVGWGIYLAAQAIHGPQCP